MASRYGKYGRRRIRSSYDDDLPVGTYGAMLDGRVYEVPADYFEDAIVFALSQMGIVGSKAKAWLDRFQDRGYDDPDWARIVAKVDELYGEYEDPYEGCTELAGFLRMNGLVSSRHSRRARRGAGIRSATYSARQPNYGGWVRDCMAQLGNYDREAASWFKKREDRMAAFREIVLEYQSIFKAAKAASEYYDEYH